MAPQRVVDFYRRLTYQRVTAKGPDTGPLVLFMRERLTVRPQVVSFRTGYFPAKGEGNTGGLTVFSSLFFNSISSTRIAGLTIETGIS
jgi:hypothetical protein